MARQLTNDKEGTWKVNGDVAYGAGSWYRMANLSGVCD